MAALLDRCNTPVVDRVRAQWQSGDGRYSMVDTLLGASDGALIVGYTGFSRFWCCPDCADSVRDA